MFSTFTGNALARLLFQAQALPAEISALGDLVISLHTADPGAAGSQQASELTYTGYARRQVARSAAGWVVTDNVARPAGRIDFPEMTGGVDQLAIWAAIGTSMAGAGRVLARARLSPDIQCRIGVIPAVKPETAFTFVTTGG